MDSNWLTVLLSNDRWLFIEYFWVLWSLSVFLYIYVYGSKACAALHLGHSSCQFSSDTPTGTSSSFFALRKSPFHSRLYWRGVSLFHFLRLPLTSFSSGHGRAVLTLLTAVHKIHKITFSLPPLRLSLAWKFSSVSVFYQVPILYRDSYRRVQGESPSRLGHFLPTAN